MNRRHLLSAAAIPVLAIAGFAIGALTQGSDAQQSHPATFTTSSNVIISTGTGTISYVATTADGRLISLPASTYSPPPANARWHVVADTYFDDQGRIIKTDAQAHAVDPLYCQPGHRPQEALTVEATPPPAVQAVVTAFTGDEVLQDREPVTGTELASVTR